MIFSVSPFRAPAWKPLALVSAISALFAVPVYGQAEEDKTLAPVVVTASRFPSDALAPIGASVITAEEIRSTGVENVNEAVRKIGGVYGRQNSYGTSDFDLDLRGFGTNSAQNMVVLVDGIRLSENEQAVALLSSIPINMVDRIEIIRGGSSVLYGDGATGGVIHVITKRGVTNGIHGSVSAEAGEFNHRAASTSLMMGRDGFSLDANASKMKSDNYRDNNAVTQENFGGGVQWTSGEGRAGFRIDAARQDSRLPGTLTMQQFKEDSQQTKTPNDYAVIDTNRYVAFIERKLNNWDIAAELSHRDKKLNSYYLSMGASSADSKQTQFSPRLRYTSELLGMKNELVTGLDFSHWNRDAESAFSQTDATQKSKAIYVRDEMKWEKTRVVLGARHEVFDKESSGSVTYDTSQSVNAWELQGSYTVTPMATLFIKGGQSYRVANVDDNAATSMANEPLKPQISHDIELGSNFGNKAHKARISFFQHRLRNEIFYDPTSPSPSGWPGANVNLDSTMRQGIEIEASTRLSAAWMLNVNYQHVQAQFTDGPYDGREMVLVPKNTATVRLSWFPAEGHTASVGMQWVDEQRYGADFDNSSSARIPSHATFDARYARKLGHWEVAIAGTNLTNKHYFTNAYGDGVTYWGIYPDAGRQLKVTARYDF